MLAACESPHGPDGNRQMRAVESPEPLARRRDVGFHAQMKTSDWWPLRVVT